MQEKKMMVASNGDGIFDIKEEKEKKDNFFKNINQIYINILIKLIN